jgi:hypothetical protein
MKGVLRRRPGRQVASTVPNMREGLRAPGEAVRKQWVLSIFF